MRSPLPERGSGHLVSVVLAAALWTAGCGGGGGGSASAATPDFAIDSISVLQGQEWQLNRPIDIVFTRDVDFSTVSFNTFNIVDGQGNGATGTFSHPTSFDGQPIRNVVRFQPACPTREDNSDAGLQPRTTYQLAVLGSQVGGLTVRSTAGDPLLNGAVVTFNTPNSDDPLALFLDTVPGPPAVRIRGAGGVADDEEAATHAEIGGVKVYFAMDLILQQGRLPGGVEVPLNHYSIPENALSIVLHLNQPVVATAKNISSDLLTLEYDDGLAWRPMQTRVELIENCTETGAAVRLTPMGIVPQDSDLRVNLKQGFADLTGDAVTTDTTNFARMRSLEANGENPVFPGITNPEVDEVLEGFALAGEEPGSLEDAAAAFEVPQANWGGGQLQASFAFGGTGGPDGDFDWHIPPATDLVLNTVSDTIVGGPGGVPEKTQAVINGVVDIRNLFIPASSKLIIQGPNPCTILASGDVLILGEISVRGSDVQSVGTLNTTNQPELGAKGQAGGGDGGTGSFLTNQSTPRGGRGFGAFNAPNGGGEGGETSYSASSKNARRGAGGGGGVLGPDVEYNHLYPTATSELVRAQVLIGLDAERGAKGGKDGLGAESQAVRADGGAVAPSPFRDEFDDNDFLGVMLTAAGKLIVGELDQVWAGSGGGGGGDAVNSDTFPLDPFTITGDEKGSGGGGAGGGLTILAIGPIQIGNSTAPGSISADGGVGGGGENTSFFDRVGGGSGGGSGGHIVLSSAAEIIVHGFSPSADTDPTSGWFRDANDKGKHVARPISALGGEGGAGQNNFGGANETGDRPWRCDRIPFDHFGPFTDVPPLFLNCFKNLPNFSDKEGGPVIGAGGDGGPGMVQFHVEDPLTRLSFPELETIQGKTYGQSGFIVTWAVAPPPLGWHTPTDPVDAMIPFFGRKSKSQSRWIALGLARVNPGGGPDQVVLRFEGTDAAGLVPHDGSSVQQLAPIVGPDPLGSFGTPPFIGVDGFTLVFDASGLSGADLVYKQNPALLRSFTVTLEESGNPQNLQRFNIAQATYDAGTDRLTCHVDAGGPDLTSFQPGGTVMASLVPHFVRLITSGIADAYPDGTSVQIMFDATKADPLTGQPSESLANGWVPDISDLNTDDWDFFRFLVEFDLDTSGSGVDLTTARPGLDHLRVSFGF